MFHFDQDFFIPILIFSLPIIAVVGGITAGIVRTLSRARLAELAARERIAAIERGVDPSKLPLPSELHAEALEETGAFYSPMRRYQGLLVGGIVTLFVGIGLGIFLHLVAGEPGVWAIGLIPGMTGLGLLLSALVIKPRGGSRPPQGPMPPR